MRSSRKTWRVLIVDDSADERAELRRLLLHGSEDRFVFSESELGAEAVALVCDGPDGPPDCLMLDYSLPDMTALDVLEGIRQGNGLPRCPVVIVTGASVAQRSGHEVLRAGAQDIIGKSWVTPEALARALQNASERWAMTLELRVREAVLAARERELTTIANNTPDILTRFDRQRRLVYVNAALTRATGRPYATWVERTLHEAGLPESLYRDWNIAIDSVFATAAERHTAFEFKGLQGLRYYGSRLVPEFGPTGEVEFVLGVTTDITERRQAELTARESTERMEMALRAAEAGVWVWDLAGEFIRWSPDNFSLYGRPVALGEPTYAEFAQMLHPEDMDDTLVAFHQALKGIKPDFRAEFRIVHPELGVRWLLGMARVEFDIAGEPLRMVGITLDITTRKETEHNLREADQHKDEFVATLAHELRNPLAPMSMGLQVLRQAPAGSPQAVKAREMMQRQLNHMVRLIDDLLDVSRISSGKLELRKNRMTMQLAIDNAVEAGMPLVRAARHALELQVDAEPIWIDGDLTRMAQCIGNLLNNAVKYTQPGGRIVIQARRVDGEAVVRVIDNGSGIAPEAMPRMFGLFAQAGNTLDSSQGGLGIGLALVRKLLALHGGSVTGESAGLGKGSVFTARVPLAAAPPAVPVPQPLVEGPRAMAAGSPAVKRRVLIVDDNTDAAESLAMMLQYSDCATHAAHSGPEALAVSQAFSPELVFLDIGLPGMNGYEVARRLRADPVTAASTLVALTGWGSAEDKQRAHDAGFDRHLTKPVDPAAIEQVLKEFDEKHPGRLSPRAAAQGRAGLAEGAASA
jgi:PAS domain S-box-containing protein